MFKPGRWWNEKNKIKIGFKLQFHASQIGGDGLALSIVPADTGKATAKLDSALVRDGRCFWENPVYETVKFTQDPKSYKIHEKIYYFVVGTTGSSKSSIVGEASIDLSSYAEVTKASLVSLPLRDSKTDALLHVSIQRIQESPDQRVIEENEITNPRFSNHGADGTIRSSSSVEDTTVSHVTDSNANNRTSSESDVTMSSSESSSELETPWELEANNNIHHEPAGCLSSTQHHEPTGDAAAPMFDEPRSSWEWLGNSAPEAFPGLQTEDGQDEVIKRLKSEVTALSRQAEMSELELQTLRKQIVKEGKRGHDLSRELVCLKEERDVLKQQFEAFHRRKYESRIKTALLFDATNSQTLVEELRQELNHANELNANLQIQLQKTQESNSELILAVQDLEEILERKNRETSTLTEKADGNIHRSGICLSDDDEQRALEELVKEHSEAKEVHLLERQITDLHSEMEICKRDKDELEMQMEQLALDYEIVKQENHDLSLRLEQGQVQERLKLQYECTNELETHIENLESTLKRQSREYEDQLIAIRELEARAKSLEEELEKQTQGFNADMENLTRSKVEQEQRAMAAEDTLKSWRTKNADTVERLQEDFRKLSLQMACTFEANETLATKALTEANELRAQKHHLEEMIEKISEENQSVRGQYEGRLCELTDQITLMMNQIENMRLEIEERAVQLVDQKRHAEESQKLLSDEILVLGEEIEMHVAKNSILAEEMGRKEALLHELEQMKRSMKVMELDMEQGNEERVELENTVTLMTKEAEEMREELKNMGCLLKQKESMVGNLQSELEGLHARRMSLERSLSGNEAEKEKLRKQVSQLTSDLKKIDDALKITKKKVKDGNARGNLDMGKVPVRASKSVLPRGSKEIESLNERIKSLEGQIKLKEAATEASAHAQLKKEKDLHSKIIELQKASRSALPTKSEAIDIDALRNEIASLKERNFSMERELKEMQGRYSEISLKFAEVEGERQQLVMELRNLRNSNRSP